MAQLQRSTANRSTAAQHSSPMSCQWPSTREPRHFMAKTSLNLLRICLSSSSSSSNNSIQCLLIIRGKRRARSVATRARFCRVGHLLTLTATAAVQRGETDLAFTRRLSPESSSAQSPPHPARNRGALLRILAPRLRLGPCDLTRCPSCIDHRLAVVQPRGATSCSRLADASDRCLVLGYASLAAQRAAMAAGRSYDPLA